MIVLRIYHGIASHAPVRATEWLMLFPVAGMGCVLALSPDMFEVSASFQSLRGWADEGTWATVLGFCTVARLAALVINGTFEGFRLSPHIRFAASLLGILFWSQWTLGFIIAWLDGGAGSAVVAYSTFCLAELLNLYRSGSDVGKDIGARNAGRN